MEQFMKFANLDEETARLAVSYYRERYSTIGIFENRVYPGIEEMLGELRKKDTFLQLRPQNRRNLFFRYWNTFIFSGIFTKWWEAR